MELLIGFVVVLVLIGLGFTLGRKNGLKTNPSHENLMRMIGPMIRVEGGSFQMGSIDSEPGRGADEVQHWVSLPDFQIQSTTVSQELYEQVTGKNPSSNKTWKDLPVTDVSWEDANAFIKKLNELTGGGYRLPTEAEWEYAARGGRLSKGYVYSGSDNLDEVGWYRGNSGERLHVSREKKPNELGLYDMSGNVWEWCSDWYGPYRTDAVGSQNPKGPDNGVYRVLRGGSWDYGALPCRSANRDRSDPSSRYFNLGFRLVFSPSSP